jgi:hypothetical protein
LQQTATIGIASSAHAQVNLQGPNWTFPWGDCPVTVGNVKWSNGAAVGGADIQCRHYHRSITAKVDLWRRINPNSPWVRVGTSDWVSTSNTYWLSVQTWPPYCGGGNAQWDDIVTVNIDGYQTTFDLYSGIKYFAWYWPC